MIADIQFKTTGKWDLEHKHKASITEHRVSGFWAYLCYSALLIICLLLNPVIAKQQLSKSSEKPNEKLQEENLTNLTGLEAKVTSGLLRHQLQQSRISIYQVEKDSKNKKELKQRIEQIRSVVFKSQNQPPKSKPVTELIPAVEPNKVDTTMPEKSKKTTSPPKSQEPVKSGYQYEPVSEHTLQILEKIMQNPNELKNPFELAEVLFLNGHTKKATILYQEALNRKDPNDLNSVQEKAWILFQMGNCLRSYDLQAARKTYRQLIAEYADYPWIDIAKVQEKMIHWYIEEKPYTLIKECKELVEGI